MSTQVRNILGTYAISKCHIHAKNKHIFYQSNHPDKIKQSKNTRQIKNCSENIQDIAVVINGDPGPGLSPPTRAGRPRG